MAKKSLGRFLAFAAITGAAAAGVSYFLKYRSFHAELEDDFHDYEDDGQDHDQPGPFETEATHRNYVPLGEKKESMEAVEQEAEDAAEAVKEAAKKAAEKAEDTAEAMKDHAKEAVNKTAGAVKDMATTIEEDTSVE